ncbi:MAG: type I glyceraldehyde-3-phosphate dehydrogenase [Synechococcales bacterium]|nr:type I glyceraldehyde-3-phosphate dehydrogenase [Synechococcales bacterium]
MKVGINGLGRIGRAALKIALDTPDMDVVAINDLIPVDNLAYLLKYDTVYGRFPKEVRYDEQTLIIDGQKYPVTSEKDPSQIPWGDRGVDVVFECTGVFRKKPDLEKHLQAGARRVILSAPAKSEGIETIVHGVNQASEQNSQIISCASCTTNCITPVVEIMGRRVGVKKAMMTTVHAYTSSQELVDGPSSKFRRGRAAAENFVPTTTGAAIATTKVLPQYENKFDGVAIRGPVPVGSLTDITLVTERATSVDEINQIFHEEAGGEQYKGILRASTDPIVSADIIQDPHASIVDLTMTQVVDGDLVKIMSWYDNEWGYAAQMVREAISVQERMAVPV